MDQRVRDLAKGLLQSGFEDLQERERRVITRIAKRVHVSRNINRAFEERLTFGERLADRVASFGGSWTFILCFAGFLVLWALLNSFVLLDRLVFDRYPYVFLNLLLSMVAAIQAPLIMMSQNRQAARDRMQAGHDYEVNLKAELEIMQLHEKIDEMRISEMARLMARQEEMLRLLVDAVRRDAGGAPKIAGPADPDPAPDRGCR
jgi:uncharacterized membrane protein